MKPRTLAFTLALALAASSAQAEPRVLADDTRTTTSIGTVFTAPRGWSIETDGAIVRLAPPGSDSSIRLVDVEAASADAAVDRAWERVGGAKTRPPVKVANDLAARDGWDAIRQYVYDVPTTARRVVTARALKRGGHWTVAIVDFAEATFDQQYGEVLKIADRMLPEPDARESFAGRKANPLEGERLDALVAFVERARRELKVPGLALGVIDRGRVVLAEGYGVRELGKPERVDADTLYLVASNTKAWTTLMLARLVDAGRITWTTPVTKLLPGFALGDAAVTSKVLVEHLVCACTGLPRQDFEWLFEFDGATAKSALATLATMKPTTPFGALYQYSNPLASAGGYVGAHLLHPALELGAAYDRAMEEQVFAPLGMRSTTFDFARAQAGNHARPHSLGPDGEVAVASMNINYSIEPVRPAGGAWSNVRDMLRYVQMELAEGKLPDGTRHVSKEALVARYEPKVALGNDVTYGMGLMVDRSWTTPSVFHGGSMIGYQTGMVWMPEHDVGLVILTNSDEGVLLMRPMHRKLVEILFDARPEADAMLAATVASRKKALAAERERLVLPPDRAQVARLAKSYRNAALGALDVERDGDRTVFDFGEWTSEIGMRRQPDGTMTFVTVTAGVQDFEFAPEADGRLVLRTPQQEYVFEAVAPAGDAAVGAYQ